jgi:hypothetical protein
MFSVPAAMKKARIAPTAQVSLWRIRMQFRKREKRVSQPRAQAVLHGRVTAGNTGLGRICKTCSRACRRCGRDNWTICCRPAGRHSSRQSRRPCRRPLLIRPSRRTDPMADREASSIVSQRLSRLVHSLVRKLSSFLSQAAKQTPPGFVLSSFRDLSSCFSFECRHGNLREISSGPVSRKQAVVHLDPRPGTENRGDPSAAGHRRISTGGGASRHLESEAALLSDNRLGRA